MSSQEVTKPVIASSEVVSYLMFEINTAISPLIYSSNYKIALSQKSTRNDSLTTFGSRHYYFHNALSFATLVATIVPGPGPLFQNPANAPIPIGQEVLMKNEFIDFLKQYGVIGLAIAVIIGGKLNALVTAVVNGIMMPIVTFFVPGGAWREATLDVGSVHFLLGPVIGAGIDFIIVAWIVFWFSKKVLKEETVTKK
jgi:large conductance mechanosensitive channel